MSPDSSTDWYDATVEPRIVRFDAVRGLGVTGKGAPGGSAHTEAVRVLYTAAGPLLRGALPALEGDWWTADPDADPFQISREEWHWRMFLRVPDEMTASPTAPVQLVTMPASQRVQAMHLGSYDKEPETLARMDAVIREHGLVWNGPHHEIYLTDVRTTRPAELRTILRQPVRESSPGPQ